MSRGLHVRTTFRALSSWPYPSTNPRQSGRVFRASWEQTLDLLDRELWYLDVAEVIIEAAFRPDDIRMDGLPRANARQPDHPGVRMWFTGRHGPLVYGTDVYSRWQHNVRAIALGLEALRAVDRHGITKAGEQYTGWLAIEPGPTGGSTSVAMPGGALSRPGRPVQPPRMTLDDAARTLGRLAGWDDPPDPSDADDVRVAYRAAKRRCHPDTGGSDELFTALERAHAVLTAAAGASS